MIQKRKDNLMLKVLGKNRNFKRRVIFGVRWGDGSNLSSEWDEILDWEKR